MKAGAKLPNVTFHTRVRDESIEGPNPFRWEDKTTADYFAGKRVILFSLPGAFTPTCSTYQLPGFEKGFEEFKSQGIDEIYCMSVNDSFVMNKWAQDQKLENSFWHTACRLCSGHAGRHTLSAGREKKLNYQYTRRPAVPS